MKKVGLLLIVTAIISGSCMRNEYFVESDYSYAGSFKKYKTFDFIEEIGPSRDSIKLRGEIQKEIKRRMEIQGYRHMTKKTDLLVAYKMFNGDFDLTGFRQPYFEKWLAHQEEDDETYDHVKYDMYNGTIIVTLMDRKKRTVVWQGYATTMFGNPYQNDKYIKWAIRSIFDQYPIVGFTQK